jgi:hypothetical protein
VGGVPFELFLAGTAADGEGTRMEPRGEDRLAAVDATPVPAGLQEVESRLDFLDLAGAHLEQSDVELDLELLGGALLVVGPDDGLRRRHLPERAALFPQDLKLRAKEPVQCRMPLRPRIATRHPRRRSHA